MNEWKLFLNEQLSDPEVRAEWEALEPEFADLRVAINKNAKTPIARKCCSAKRTLRPRSTSNEYVLHEDI